MSKVYSEKRERMRVRLQAWGEADCLGHDDKFKISSGLLVDGLCRDLGDQFKVLSQLHMYNCGDLNYGVVKYCTAKARKWNMF